MIAHFVIYYLCIAIPSLLWVILNRCVPGIEHGLMTYGIKMGFSNRHVAENLAEGAWWIVVITTFIAQLIIIPLLGIVVLASAMASALLLGTFDTIFSTNLQRSSYKKIIAGLRWLRENGKTE